MGLCFDTIVNSEKVEAFECRRANILDLLIIFIAFLMSIFCMHIVHFLQRSYDFVGKLKNYKQLSILYAE